jgi:hypothetical protein
LLQRTDELLSFLGTTLADSLHFLSELLFGLLHERFPPLVGLLQDVFFPVNLGHNGLLVQPVKLFLQSLILLGQPLQVK